MTGWQITGLVALVVVVLLTALSFGAATGQLRRDTRMGLYSKALVASDAAWARGHRAALRHLIVADAAAVAGLIVALVAVEAGSSVWPWIVLPIAAVVIVAALYRGTKVADTAAKKAERRRQRPLS